MWKICHKFYSILNCFILIIYKKNYYDIKIARFFIILIGILVVFEIVFYLFFIQLNNNNDNLKNAHFIPHIFGFLSGAIFSFNLFFTNYENLVLRILSILGYFLYLIFLTLVLFLNLFVVFNK
jgi:hypothetical protein